MAFPPFFLCHDCGSDAFLLTPDRGKREEWFVICKTCVSCYELWPNGRIQLVRTGIQTCSTASPTSAARSFSATET